MGSGRDKRKKAKGGSSGQGGAKTAKKTEKNEEKAIRRAEKRAEGGEDDLDALLAKFALEDSQKDKVEVKSDVACPSARVYASYTAVTPDKKDSDILMFGGEFLDIENDKMYVKNDLYLFHTDSHTWSQIITPNGPAPRTAHQAAIIRNSLYVFGGELTSINQEKFRHYRDLWRLDLRDWKWELLKMKKSPSARSGHRMLAHKNQLILFGGFHDDDKTQAYYNDVWRFDPETLEWKYLETKGKQPACRGGCQLAIYNEVLYVFGGHSVVRNKGDETDKVHDDVWGLDLKTLEWENIKKAGIAPRPRTSFGMVSHKNRAYLFGGVADQAGKGDRIYSENFDEMYQFNLDQSIRRWFPVTMRNPAKSQVAKAQKDGSSMEHSDKGDQSSEDAVKPAVESLVAGGAVDKDSVLYKAAARIQSRYRGYVVRKAYKTYKLGGKLSELLYSPATYGVDFSSKTMLRPRARQAPLMTVVKNNLYLMGGIVEVAHTDVVLDDIWTLDLVKLDGWKCVKENTQGEEAFKEDSDWETDDKGSDDDD